MKDINFLNKIKKQKKIKLVEPSNIIKNSYLKKLESNLSSAKILLENKKFEEAISLIYYSMYNSLLALLFKIGIKSENHTASIMLLKRLFELENTSILFAKKERIQTQYHLNFQIEIQEARKLIFLAEDFNAYLLDFISKLTNEEIKTYRNKFIKLLNLYNK